MKKSILTLSLLLFLVVVKAQQGDVFGVLSYNSTNCRLQVEYWINNPTMGNGSFDIAISKVNLQWDTTLFSFVSFTSYTDGLNKYPDHWRGDASDPAAPDTAISGSRTVTSYSINKIDTVVTTTYDTTYNMVIDTVVTTTYDTTYNMVIDTFLISPVTGADTIFYDTTYTINTINTLNTTTYDTTYTINTINTLNTTTYDTSYNYSQSLYHTLTVQRSTDSCNNLFKIPGGQSRPVLSAVLQFRNCDSASNYTYTDPNAPDFIGDFANTTDTVSSKKKILFVLGQESRPFDPSGSKCDAGTRIKSLNNIPIGADSAKFVNTQAPLAVQFLYLDVYKQNNRAVLKWETASESNNMGFEIQRKTNNKFENIGFVPSNTVGGNSSQNLSYIFSDEDILNTGITYYRLKQINYTGKEVYSEIKAIINNTKSLQVLVYPNPGNGKINIVLPDGNGTTDISMIDFSGKLIRTWTGYKIPNIQLTNLKRGIYTLLISNRETGEKVSQKITVQ
ncbi:MAG: T9SS type A sorting domain-containing protein [Sphingobacteriales bacterium]